MHYYLSRNLLAVPHDISDVEGSTWFHPSWIVWERPLFLVALHPFATHGLTAFRVGHLLVSSLLPVSAYVAVRAYGGHRLTAGAAGLACAALPSLVAWGVLGVMDEWMALLLAFALAARQRGHHVLAGVLFLLSIWAKETAWAAVAAVALLSFTKAWVRGEATIMPFSADRPTTPLLAALALGPIPLVMSLMTGLNQFGGYGTDYGDRLVDFLYVTPWFIPPLVLGLLWKVSRPLCGFALFWATGYLLSHVLLHRSVEAWYFAAPVAFSLMGGALALEQALLHSGTGLRKAAAGMATAGAVALVLVLVLVPASAAKGAWTHPLTGQPDDSWKGTLDYEGLVRDRPLVHAKEAMHHVWVDSAIVRDYAPFWTDHLVDRLETNGTWLLVQRSDTAMYHALNEAYVDCRVLDEGDLRLYETWRCPGRKDVLDQGFASRYFG
jgi:hypothetical protein